MIQKHQNKLKVNRLANRQSDFIRITPNPFRFSTKYDSNRLYIAHSQAPFFRQIR